MAVATFDTLKFANTLKAAGVPPQQAEAQAAAFSEVIQGNFKELVTKDDLKQAFGTADDKLAATATGLRQEIKEVEQQLTIKINDVEQRLNVKIDNSVAEIKVQIAQVKGEQILLRWMMGATFAGVLATLGLLARLMFIMPR